MSFICAYCDSEDVTYFVKTKNGFEWRCKDHKEGVSNRKYVKGYLRKKKQVEKTSC